MANNDHGIRPRVAREIQSILSNNEDGHRTYIILCHLFPSLNETEMVAVAEAIRGNTHMEYVTLASILRGSPAAATSTFLSKVLETHPSLKEVNLDGNNLNCNLAQAIGLALKTNTSLKVLELNSNGIGAAGAEALADGLRHNKSLQIFRLWINQVGDRGATALAEVLSVNKTLEALFLNSNGVTMTGGKALASALEKASLKGLRLSNNQLQDEGGKALAESLCKNKSLTRLDLDSTFIGDETCEAFAAALCNNSSLKTLRLYGNLRITTIGATAIEDTLKHMNYTVESIALQAGYAIPNKQVVRIRHLCAQNRRLNTFMQRINRNIPAIPLGAWPRVFEAVECKPDLLFALLKTKPEVCREQRYNHRRRRCPD